MSRQKILDNIDVCYDGGEYPQVARDKLLFLQELLCARCISEEEYPAAKKSLLYRLAAQGAEINSSDIVLSCLAATASAPTSPVRARMKNAGDDPREKLKDEAMQRVAKSKSPVQHLFEAASRVGRITREEFLTDWTRLYQCQRLESDTSDQCRSPLFHSPSGSVSTMESSSNGFFSTVGNSPKAPPSAEACSDDDGKSFQGSRVCRSMLKEERNPAKAPPSAEACSKNGFASTLERPVEASSTKKFQAEGGASTDFYIDKVLGENIKELERDQQADSSMIMTLTHCKWVQERSNRCNCHGADALLSKSRERRHNNAITSKQMSSKSSVNTRCFTSTDESSPRPNKVTSFNASVEQSERELDGKLCAEIEKLPHRKTPLRV
ncbi:hypothetical protein SELMODRAFT_416831 [Selaginella moellendorffii]|uniref:Uncharacterized protein n=1 Tax=Selaginella moellendorffii TaxID=88036 RepID=D8S0J4_SELML|nr:hypothetical protein SELMODRAFT_416831 [Selaginella moellendorffii]